MYGQLLLEQPPSRQSRAQGVTVDTMFGAFYQRQAAKYWPNSSETRRFI
jgi:hypothetical protein